MKTFPVQYAAVRKDKPDPDTLVFGRSFTDHMFQMDYTEGKGWHDGRIVPYGPLPLEPSAMVFHYAQEVFEGLKAYRNPQGKVQLFRPMENVRRMNNSCERMCIPQLDEETALSAIEQLVELEADWVPSKPGTSLYIRPFIIATTPTLGVHAAHNYIFAIICCPVGSYYKEGINPVRIYVESRDVRAVRGGTGYAKCGGNYAASIRAGEQAEKQGYAQVLWLDGVERKYIEEVGSMNVLFKINGTVVTPALTGSVLPGITRKSCLELLRSWGVPVEERLITAQELFDAAEAGALEEAFGSGTAAVVSPIGEMGWNDRHVVVNGGQIGPLTQRLYDTLTGIQWGTQPDPFGWITKLD
ncbi:branched-chain amino acid aminotransferase [Lawsonibacter celer]|uniref:branched-chain amino acid aminotransferase n=1 Tax=Lawsonibacter celer TaxID=2986526 RepID=UPI0016474FCB|nr:branched-chain amino acid aminotransferase [Lawsonibacter celer]